ncbi:MAG TPA: bifunctional homocysteine S-methyltransferase/methylenetetrahydrofolate reductase [Cyanobacteria bacterium UBA8530]|nr:bifunctional homocysteine S-methyltransferase/methylenetetrahydrofolate reductase [Cyanobacteria bacterium UBA8530]
MSRDFRKVLEEGRIHVFDGAMGTMIYQRGVFINRSYDELCLTMPDMIRDIHRAYLEAGCEIIETNSFGANRPHLAAHGLQEKVFIINQRAAEIAREAGGEQAFVAGSVGPLGIRLKPYGSVSAKEARAFFKESIEGLVAGGIDLLLLETFSDLHEMRQAIRAAQETCHLPIVAQMTIQVDGKTTFGHSPEDIVKALDRWGADVIGLNCSVGPAAMLEAIERMRPLTKKPLSAQPNAGMPREIEGRKMYMSSPEYMAEYAKRLIQKGVRFVGGCCGTTPEHIRLIRDAARALSPRRTAELILVEDRGDARQESKRLTPVPAEQRSQFAAKLLGGEFVSSVEILPPRGADISSLLQGVKSIKEAGVDVVNVPDGPRAQSRMGVLATSHLIEREVGIEAVMHYACRDRNILGMQSDLLGAAALGLRNLLLVTGDPPKMGPYPLATAVFDIDSIGLVSMVNNLNHGLDLGRNPIGKPTAFFLGVGVNPCALDLEQELRRFAQKIEAGAQYAITQPVFDPRQLEIFLERTESFRIPIIAGIWPLVSFRNAEFLSSEVAGVVIPHSVMERMRKIGDPEQATLEGIMIAREMLAEVRGGISGVQVSAPLGKIPLALEVFRK